MTPITATLQGIPGGKRGTLSTLRKMRSLAVRGASTWPIRGCAMSLVSYLPNKDYAGEARALHRFVQSNIRYLKDVHNVETLATPEKTLEFRQGDCDDHATLLASLLLSIGHPVRFVAIGYVPGRFDHVFLETNLHGNWVPMETTEPWKMGKRHNEPVEKMVLTV